MNYLIKFTAELLNEPNFVWHRKEIRKAIYNLIIAIPFILFCVYFQKEPGNDNRGMRYRHFRAKHWYFLRFNCLKTFITFCFLGIFAFPKVRRLLEDESIRELACQRLNLGLIVRYGEDEFIQTSVRFSLNFSKKSKWMFHF